MKLLLSFLLVIFFLPFGWSQVEKQWATEPWFDVPESVYYHTDEIIFVSNISGQPTDQDGKGFISIMNASGEMLNKNWVTGLDAPKGMGVFDNLLYVTNINELIIIDIDKAEILETIEIPDARFLNDIAIDGEGAVYFSDMTANMIYKYQKGEWEAWLTNGLENPNGLAWEQDMLVVGMKDKILWVDPASKDVQLVVEGTGGIDGIIPLGQQTYIISDWSGKVQKVGKGIDNQVLFDTTNDKINAADLGWNERKKILYVPTFFDNRVVAYRFTQ